MPDQLKETLIQREGAKVGPFKGRLLDERDSGAELRPGFKGSLVDEQPRDIPSMGQLIDKLTEMGILPSMSDMGRGSNVMEAVAAVKPARIPGLKQRGMELIEKMRTLPTFQGFEPAQVSAYTRAQSEYPRVFGHLSEISPTLRPYKDLPKNTVASFWPPVGKAGGAIELKPGLPVDHQMDSVAHELTHAAQAIAKGGGRKSHEIYDALEKSHGYVDNPMERGARKAGERFATGAKYKRK